MSLKFKVPGMIIGLAIVSAGLMQGCDMFDAYHDDRSTSSASMQVIAYNPPDNGGPVVTTGTGTRHRGSGRREDGNV